MSLNEDSIPGAALASLELHRTLITLLVLHRVVPRDLTIELLDQTLLRVEKMQGAGNASLEAAARGARFHIESLLIGMKKLPLPPASGDPQQPA